MRDPIILVLHCIVTLAKLLRPGGVNAVMAEPILMKHQLLISNRFRHRASNLTSFDRIVLDLLSPFMSARRFARIAVVIKPATLLRFHTALVKRKYRLLFSSASVGRKP